MGKTTIIVVIRRSLCPDCLVHRGSCWVHIYDLCLKIGTGQTPWLFLPAGLQAQDKPLWGGFGSPLSAVPMLPGDPLQVCSGKEVQGAVALFRGAEVRGLYFLQAVGLSAKPH